MRPDVLERVQCSQRMLGKSAQKRARVEVCAPSRPADPTKPGPVASDGGFPVERTELLRLLSDRELEHWQSRGLSPVKARQLATEKMREWKNLTDEQLKKIFDEAESGY